MAWSAETPPEAAPRPDVAPAWDDIRAFLAVATTGSLPGAARSLGVSAITVGRRVQALEATLGMALFERKANRLDLTDAGRSLAAAGSGMDAAAAAFVATARRVAAPENAVVRVSATMSVSLFLATHAVRVSELLRPGRVQLVMLTTRARQDPARGETDLALRMRRLPETGPLAARKLGEIAFAVYGRRDRPTDAVIGLPSNPRAGSQSGWLDAYADRSGLKVELRLSDVSVRHRAARDGAGATLLPCFLGDADDQLVRLDAPPTELVESVFMVRHELVRTENHVGSVMAALADLFEERRAALRGQAHDRQGPLQARFEQATGLPSGRSIAVVD